MRLFWSSGHVDREQWPADCCQTLSGHETEKYTAWSNCSISQYWHTVSYFIQHLIPHVYSSQVLSRPLSATIRLWDKQLISTDIWRSTKEGQQVGEHQEYPAPSQGSTQPTTHPLPQAQRHTSRGEPQHPSQRHNLPTIYQIQQLPNNHYHSKSAKRTSQSRTAQKNWHAVLHLNNGLRVPTVSQLGATWTRRVWFGTAVLENDPLSGTTALRPKHPSASATKLILQLLHM